MFTIDYEQNKAYEYFSKKCPIDARRLASLGAVAGTIAIRSGECPQKYRYLHFVTGIEER